MRESSGLHEHEDVMWVEGKVGSGKFSMRRNHLSCKEFGIKKAEEK
jgi:hypothetical protein